MKKVLYAAMMALVMVFMASCNNGAGGSSQYTQGGKEPAIDNEAGTVNGKAYDTKTSCCWEITEHVTVSVAGITSSADETYYMWGTEFEIVSIMEESMWSVAQSGKYGSASYSYKKANASDYESCDALNNNDDQY